MREYIEVAALAARLEVEPTTIAAMAEAASYRLAESGGRRYIRLADAAEIVRELDAGPERRDCRRA